MVEHFLEAEGVAGSSPVPGTNRVVWGYNARVSETPYMGRKK